MARFKEVLFNDGEGVDLADFNNLQRFLRSQLHDTFGVIARIDDVVRNGTDIAPHNDAPYIFCVAHSGAPYPGASARQITNLPGVIYQQTGSGIISGDDPEFTSYYLAQGEMLSTLAIGDATNPRWDILSVKIDHLAGDSESRAFEDATTHVVTSQSMNKRRNVRLQFQITQGTPAADPAEPVTPAGYSKVCAILVPANHNAVIDPANIVDYRLPIGLSTYEITAAELATNKMSTVTAASVNWTVGGFAGGFGAYGFAQAAASGQDVIALVRDVPSNTRRLLEIRLGSYNSSPSHFAITLNRYQLDNAGGETALAAGIDHGLGTLTADLLPASPSGSGNVKTKSFLDLPYWANGYRSGYAKQESGVGGSDSATQFQRLGLKLAASVFSDNRFIGPIRFVFAGGGL